MPLLAYTRESGLGRIVQAGVGARIEQLRARPVFSAHLATVLRTMALDGRGIAWLPRTLIEEDLVRGRLVRAASSAWDVPLQIRLYRDAEVPGRVAEAFWRAALASCRGRPAADLHSASEPTGGRDD